jgi:hypothetical protein
VGRKSRTMMFSEMERNGKEKLAIYHLLSDQGLKVGLVLTLLPPYPN